MYIFGDAPPDLSPSVLIAGVLLGMMGGQEKEKEKEKHRFYHDKLREAEDLTPHCIYTEYVP